MICNKTISLRIFTWIISPGLLLLSLIAASAFADDKIGLDLEWRPITGVPSPPPPVPEKIRLYVDAEPGGAGIRILNIAPKFYQGMELTPGRYHVEVSARGFVTHREWVPVSGDGERRVAVSLRRISVKSEPARVRPVSPPPAARGEKVETVTVNGVSFKMVRIPDGEFMMGSPSGEPGRDSDEKRHRVRISKSFFLGETEVTQGLWRAVMGSNPSYFKNCGDKCPVEQVSWKDCREFIGKLNRLVPGGGFRLPTEAEWEYAARAGSRGAIYAGVMKILGKNNAPALDPIAWYGGNSCVSYSGGRDCSGWPEKQISCGSCGTHLVGRKKPNAFGLYDMIGNVLEWCGDWYGDYPSGSVTDPTGPSSGSDRVLRGGSWGSIARGCRSADRYRDDPGIRDGYYGFRLARF
jgi:formylglycine-generating enzyme required for sulfatase activity